MTLRSFSHKKWAVRICSALALCFLAAFLFFKSDDQEVSASRSGFYFDTAITLTGYGENAAEVLEDGLRLCEFYENLLSRTKEGSDIWKINHAEGQAVTVQPETADLIAQALDYAEMTDGLIDPTIAPLADLWNFSGSPAGPVPSDSAIQKLLSHVDYTAVIVEGNTIRLNDPEARLDLGFIAKGYIADRLKELFLREGLSSALIDLGGNILAVGSKPGAEGFSIGIRKPFGERYDTLRILSLNDRSLVSSGTYERYITVDGKQYHHLLDSSTGYPCENGLTSVTIISPQSVDGDGLSTSCFCLGLEDGMKLIESMPDCYGIFITSDGEIHLSEGLEDHITVSY